ncbi:MAG TPA: hypothetical protein VF648_09055 [Pyrinomonadaceae bacterium]|jgi:hypothetical protein
MWSFRRKAKHQVDGGDENVLRVLLDTQELCSFTSSELSAEKKPVAELKSGQHLLHFVDSAGNARSFDLSSVFAEGGRFLHMSVRVGSTFAVQADCIVTEGTDDNPQEAYQSGDAIGVRFQPFMLPEFTGDTSELVGKGLFFRGLHFSGSVTPGNVSALCLCDYCQKSFRLQSFHAGFADLIYLYCSDGPHTLVASSRIEDAPPILGKADTESVARFERRLPKCHECGGSFRYMNPLLCPHCREPFIDFKRHPREREKEYYGNHLYGGSIQVFKEPTP